MRADMFDKRALKMSRAIEKRRNTEPTTVIFRTWKPELGSHQDGQVIALFPDLLEGPGLCNSYMHIGQHGAAEYTFILRRTRAATPEEYADLAEELRSIGYVLSVKSRYTRR